MSQPIRLIDVNSPQRSTSLPADLRWYKVQEFLTASGLAANSRKTYDRELNRFLGWSDLGWSEFKPRHIAHFKQYLLEELELKPNSANTALTALKSFFRWLHTFSPDLCPSNPTAPVKFERVPLPPAQSLTADEVERVWEAVSALGETRLRDTALIHLLSHGLRAGEVVSLTIGAYDGKLLFLADTKTDEPRLVPLRKEGREAVAYYLESRADQGEDLTSDRPLLLSHKPRREWAPLSYHGVYFAVERIGELAGLEDLHPHVFRHTYATGLLLAGVDPVHARKLTGHRSDKAFKRYVLRSEQEAAIAAYYRAIGEDQ